MSFVANPDEIIKAGKQEWDIDACWAIEEDRLAGDLRNTVASQLNKGEPGAEKRKSECLSDTSILSEKQSFFKDYCERASSLLRPELISQGMRGDIRAASPRKAAVNAWRIMFWFSVTLEWGCFSELVRREEEPKIILLCVLFIFIGSWLAGYGISKYLIKSHIDHPSNNLIYSIANNNENKRESNITGMEIWFLFVFGKLIFGASLWFLVKLSESPPYVFAIGLISGLMIFLAEALHSYSKDIRRRLLQLMFQAQTMYAIEKHILLNPPCDDGNLIPDDKFAEKYRNEVIKQFNSVSSRFS